MTVKPFARPIPETLAVVHLRQWLRDKTRAATGHATSYRVVGWRERRMRDADAIIVRILDFESALALLTPEQQELLTIVYGHGQSQEEAAALMRRTPHTIASHLAIARRKLAEILERRGLL